jgi:hypothetical protein
MRIAPAPWTIVAAVILLAGSHAAYAVDGLVLIDQAKALAGNVTPGDAPGFPVTLSLPGSYRLSGNLNVPSTLVGISITATNVTIDLNGFSLTTPFPQAQQSPSRGILWEGSVLPSGITVRNGTVEGFLFPIQLVVSLPSGFFKCRRCTFEDVLLRSAFGGSASFDLGSRTRIRNVTAPDLDINVRCPSVVSETVARSISQGFPFATDIEPNIGQCTFAHNATEF